MKGKLLQPWLCIISLQPYPNIINSFTIVSSSSSVGRKVMQVSLTQMKSPWSIRTVMLQCRQHCHLSMPFQLHLTFHSCYLTPSPCAHQYSCDLFLLVKSNSLLANSSIHQVIVFLTKRWKNKTLMFRLLCCSLLQPKGYILAETSGFSSFSWIEDTLIDRAASSFHNFPHPPVPLLFAGL